MHMEKPETETTPIKEVKENGQGDDAPEDEPTEGAPPAQETAEEEQSAEVKEGEKDEEKGQDEADKPEKEQQDEGESEEESSEDEPQVGSLDGPVKIMTGKRERKKVERLTMQSPKEKDKEKFEIKDGRGIKLGDCPIIEYNIQRTHADVLKPLYRILFWKAGKTSEVKKNIRKFSGFPFTKEDTAEVQRKEKQLDRFTLTGLKELCSFLALERGGKKEEIMARIIDYCLEPTMIERKPPVKRKKGSKKSGKKKKVDEKGDSGKKRRSKSGEPAEDEEEEEEEEEDMEQDEEQEEEEPEEESEAEEDSDYEEKPKKKRARTETPKSAKKSKSKTPKKTPTKKSASKAKVSDDESSDDEAPLVKKSNSPPSESEIRTVITKFLDGANLEQVTMKTVCKKVYETYPDFDLTPKKDFIKSTVKEIISS